MNTKQNAGKQNAVKWPVLLTAGALAVAPYLNPIAVHAAPKSRVWDDRNYKVHVNPTNNYGYNAVGNVTLSGVVISDLAGNEFNFRANNGRIYRVVTTRREPGWLNNGDRVTVQGRINDAKQNRIVATNVTQSGVGGVGGGVLQNITVSGVVVSDLQGNEFNMRANDGRIYRVVTNRREPGWLSNGDTVTVQGRIDSLNQNRIVATNVTHPGGGNVGNGVGVGQNVSLSGVVTRDPAGNQFSFRADNGQTYRVITNNQEPGWLTTGDRVTVRGRVDNRDRTLIIATNVTHPNGTGGVGGGVGQSITVRGVVTRDPAGNQFTIRADNGQTYRVITNNQEPGWLTNGDQVTVQGRLDARDRTLIIATNVTHPNGVGGVGAGLNINVSGVVTRDPVGNQFTIRADNGQTYRVITNNQEPGWLTNGDRVTVQGRVDARDRTLIIATNVIHPGGSAGGVGSVVSLAGVVSRDRNGNQFTFRSDNGQTYRVITTNREPGWLTTGDRVVVRGRIDARDRGLIVATSVDHPAGTVRTNGSVVGNGAVNFLGRVESASNNGLIRTLRVRGDNGVPYSVTYRNLQTFRVGDRVQVIGTFVNNRVNASSVTIR